MNPLTLEMLRNAVKIVTIAKRFKDRPAGLDLELQRALAYLNGEKINQPRDPREVLAELGFKL